MIYTPDDYSGFGLRRGLKIEKVLLLISLHNSKLVIFCDFPFLQGKFCLNSEPPPTIGSDLESLLRFFCLPVFTFLEELEKKWIVKH